MANNSPKKRKRKTRVGGILGIGLDNEDGQKRITRTEEMVLVGGSHETHERMQETAITKWTRLFPMFQRSCSVSKPPIAFRFCSAI